jgi:hypothetical protein
MRGRMDVFFVGKSLAGSRCAGCRVEVYRCRAFRGLVKREAGETPALTRSGDGNERRRARATHCSEENGKRRLVGSPKSEDRPVATTMEEQCSDLACVEDAGLEDRPIANVPVLPPVAAIRAPAHGWFPWHYEENRMSSVLNSPVRRHPRIDCGAGCGCDLDGDGAITDGDAAGVPEAWVSE